MFINNLNPVLLRLGPLEVRYYGIMFALGFVIAYFFLRWWARQGKVKNFKPHQVEDYLLYILIGSVLGSRLVYVIFYNLPFYLSNLSEIVAVWHGGLSFHGGFLGAIAAAFYYCRKHNIHFWQMADATAIPLAIGLFFGRIANFINGELYGRVTSLPWCVKFNAVDGCRHPSQIYEALKNLLIFSVLWKIKDKKHPDGFLMLTFVMMYSFIRFFIEFVRQPDSQLGVVFAGLTMGQLFCIVMFAIGSYFMYKIHRK